MSDIAKVLLASGVSGFVAALVAVVFLAPAVQKAIEHTYARILEHVKTDQALVKKRYDLAADAMKQLSEMFEELLREVASIKVEAGEKPLTRLLENVHPTFRGRYRVIRSQLEPANDLLSFYSLGFDALLHPQTIKRLLADACVKNTGDTKYAYRTVWLSVIESLQSLLRVTASHQFWSPDRAYPDRARAWAQYDKELLYQHLVTRLRGEFSADDYYALTLEQEGGVDRFWREFPPNNG